MKIGIITNIYPPYTRGGAENVVVRTVEQLLAMGHDVFVITGHPRARGRGVTLGTLSVERVYRFFPTNVYFTLDDYLHRAPVRLLWHIIDAFCWRGAHVVRTILADEAPDVVITHNLKGLGLRIPAAIRAAGIPHAHVLHDLQLITPSGLRIHGKEREPWYAAWAYRLYRAICRARLGSPSLVISPSQFLADEYRHAKFFSKSIVRILPNPSPELSPLMHARSVEGPLKLLFVGQLGYHKGLLFLLDTFAKLSFDARLLIVGGGPMRAMVEARAAQDARVMFLGYMAPQEVMSCMASVDAVVVPSLCYENSPTVIYEALSMGVPIIASRIGGVGELVVEGETGVLFSPGDADDLVRALEEMNGKKHEFAHRSERVQASIAPFVLAEYGAKLVALLTEIAQKGLRADR